MQLIHLVSSLAAQVDSAAGTLQAQRGAVARLQDPNAYDVVFPFIAFGLVIVLPTVTALWVMMKVLTEKRIEPDET